MKKNVLSAVCVCFVACVALYLARRAPAPALHTASHTEQVSPAVASRNFELHALPASKPVAPMVAPPATDVTVAQLAPPASPTAFDEFASWVHQFTNASANIVEGQRLAFKRREAMLQLVENDPARALQLAVPFSWRQALPVEVTRLFEEQVDGRGDFKVAVGTDFEQGHTTVFRTVEIAKKSYKAFVYGRRLGQPCKNNIPLHGISLEGKIALHADPLRSLSLEEASALAKSRGRPLEPICGVSGNSVTSRNQPVYAEGGGGILCFCGTDHYELVNRQWAASEDAGFGGSGVAGVGGSVDDSWTHGPKSLLYMRVNFPDDLSEPISADAAYASMVGVDSYYVANSYNLTSIDPTVAPLVTLPQPKAWYATTGPGQLQADAREATRLAGYDTATYDRDIVAFTPVQGYSFGGLAYVGGKGVWLQSTGVGVAAHELGHNYGLWHANFWDTTTNFSGFGPGTNLEYGNIYDTMGSAGAGIYQFNTAHKSKLDWLKADAVQVITSNGVYRIYPFDVPDWQRVDGRYYAAAVQKDALRYYWMEFRQLFNNPWNQSGVLLNWSPWSQSSGGTQLIDTTPGSPTFSSDSREDAAVVVGRTFNDNPAGVHITTLDRGSSGLDPYLDVQVNIGGFPGNQPPTLRLEIDQATNVVASGTLVHFHATASDPDGDTLAYAWSFDDLTFSTNNQPWVSKTFSTSGDHLVRCVVSDMKGGESSANLIITVGRQAGYRVSGVVTDTNGAPLEGVLVSNGSSSQSSFLGCWSDSSGRYVIPNVTTDLTVTAVEFGYLFSNTTNWSMPLSLTNDVTNADFVGIALPAVNIAVDTNAVAKNDGTTHYFTVTRFGDTNNDLNIPLYVSGTAAVGSDYILNPVAGTNLTIPAGSNTVQFAFQAINNARLTGPLTSTLTLGDDPNYGNPGYALAPLAAATITILGNNSGVQPTVTVATPTPEVSENGMDSGQFVFTRSGSLQNALAVYYSVAGSASPGNDYSALAGVALIPAGQTSVTIPFEPVGDTTLSNEKTVIVTVQANAAYTVGSPASASVTILEDDFTSVMIFPAADASKPGTPGRFTVQRDGDLTDNLVVFYNVSGTAVPGTDYQALPNSVTIPAGSSSATFSVNPMHNNTVEGDVFVTVTLTNNYNYDVGTSGSATIPIHDDHLPTLSISAPVGQISEQGNMPGEFVISRGAVIGGDLTVYLAISGSATPGADYLTLNNPVVIPNGSTSVTLDVIAFHDLIWEPTEDVVVTLQPNTNYNVGFAATARVEITDDGTSQTPGVGFCAASSAVVESESPGIAVCLSLTSSVPVTVDYQVIGGTAPQSRYSLPPGTLTIPASNLVAFIPLQVFDDSIVEPPQTVQVVLFNPTNATMDAIRVHTYTILDDDANSVNVTTTAAIANEGGAPGNFRISRSGPTTSNLLVNFQVTGSASAPNDYLPLGNSVTIPAGKAFVDLPVVPVANLTTENDESVVLTLTTVPGGNIISPNQATVTIIDNNTNPLPIVSVTSSNHAYSVEGGVNGGFLFTRTGPSSNSLTLSFTTSGTAAAGVRYVPLTGSVTIPAGQSSVLLPVTAIDDTVVQGEQTVTIWLTDNETYRVAYPSSATVTIQDNDQNVWIDASDFYASKYGPDPGQFTFSRFGTTNNAVTIYYTISGTASNGFDYVTITNSIVLPAGSLTATLPILPLHNGVVEGPVTVVLTLLTNAAYQLGSPVTATVVIDDDMPMLRIFTVADNVLEGSGSNGVFRLIRTGDPKFDFTAYLNVGGTATYGVDYPGFPTNIYFTCGMTSIDLFVTPTNELAVEGSESVMATILPNPSYTVLSPNRASMTILDAGTNATPQVVITNPVSGIAFLVGTNIGLVINAVVTDDQPSNTLSWTQVSGPDTYVISSTNTADTTILFTNTGIYRFRLTADDGQLQGHADVVAIVAEDLLSATNLLHWTFDDGAGTNVLDASGSGRDGQFVGMPLWTTNGVLGGALNFSGTNDCVRQVRKTNFLNGLNQFTLSLWLKPGSTNLNQGCLTANDTGTNQPLSVATRAFASCGQYTNVVEVALPTPAGFVRRSSAGGVVQPFQWCNVAVSWSNGLAPALYINGLPDQPGAGFVPAVGFLTNCPAFFVGKGAPDSPASWNGTIDDVRFFPRALSAEEILAIDGWASTNHAPFVDAGSNVTVQIGLPVTLVGTVSDDGLPNPPGRVVTTWTYLGTNSNVTIPDPSSLTNTFTFSDPGDYVFQLAASDGQATSFALVTVTVIPPTQVDIFASVSDAYELGPVNGEFMLMRNGATNDLTVYLNISGTASNGLDYAQIPASVTFADGSNTVFLEVPPALDYEIEGDESVIVTILTNIAYYVGNGQATVTIHDSPYGLWSIAHFTLEQLTHPEVSGPGADFNHDGVPNFAEYALNRDPTGTNQGPAFAWSFLTDTNDNLRHLTFTYTRRLPPRDVQYGVFVSTNLLKWYTGSNYLEEFSTSPDTNGITETVMTRALSSFPGTNNLFMNLRVWLQQVPN